jgi:iron complex transport system substrate-binding protein
VRIASLLPSATEIVFALGLGGDLVGVSHECPVPPGARGIAVLTRAVDDPDRVPSHTLHRLVEGSLQAGTTIWALDEQAFADARPDLVLAGPRCRACNVGYREVVEVAHRLAGDATVMNLAPTSVEGILNSIQAVGAMTEAEDAAIDLVGGLRERLQAVAEIVVGRRDHGFDPPRVAALAWLAPPFATGSWVPEQVRLAGGWELLGRDGGPSVETSWDALREVDPEVMVLMPHGLDLAEAITAWSRTPRPAGWADIRAVRERRVYAVDAEAHFSRPGTRVVDGIEVLAELLDPLAFDGMAPPESWARVD